VQGYTRHQLKRDRFAETAQDAAQWTAGHQRAVLWGLGLAVLAVAGYFGFTTWQDKQSEKANLALAAATRVLNTPLRPAATPAGDAQTKDTFASTGERAKAAQKEFKAAADQYDRFPYPKAARVARYMEGITDMQAGDNAQAETVLKSVAESHDKSVAALAKIGLAQLYRNTNRLSDAARIYKDLEDHPADTVSKVQAQLAMAEMYEIADPQQAAILYQQIQKENAATPAGQIAASRLASIK
jgi:predicted negative regulator of RcsB-dependent stress response